MNEEKRQAQWESHSRDEEDAIQRQQLAAGASHEPVVDSVTQRIQEGKTDFPSDAERQRCIGILRRWSDPGVFLPVTGPLDANARGAVERTLRAIEAEVAEADVFLPCGTAQTHA